VGLWVVVATVVSVGRPTGLAIVQATVALGAAVAAFYVGLDAIYHLKYPGFPYSVNLELMVLWLCVAVAAGAGIGVLAARIRPAGGTSSAVATEWWSP
jgi:hypothetical protein